MTRSALRLLIRVIGVSVVGVVAGASARSAGLPHLATDEAREVSFLIDSGTPDSLASASLLAHLVDDRNGREQRPDPAELMQRAVALAPQRPELIWLLLRDCDIRRCADEKQIVARLRAIDPQNGAALLPELRASQGGPAAETTRILAQIGACKTLSLHWNKSLVMMFEAMTHGMKSRPATAITHDADDRLTHAAAVLAAVDIPPFRPIVAFCGSDQFQETGRREACEHVMARLDASDSIIAQSLSVSVQLKWWAAGSAQANALQVKRLQQQYLVQASGRARGVHVNQDAEMRIAAMRRAATEEEAAQAMLSAFHEPLERPADWQSPGGA